MRNFFGFFILCVLIFSGLPAHGETADERYRSYISEFAPMAIEQQQLFGIPASITLAQGLLESAAGHSTLAREGNNHFGIKCHRDWEGATMLRSDDAPDECFRVYESAADSFADHSRFLSRSRYQPLFLLDPADYASWARTLRDCGYATDPHYADRLIAIIERYGLYSYDAEARGQAAEIAEFITAALRESHPVRRAKKLHYVIAAPGDTYASIAKEFNMQTSDLLAYNDSRKDGEIRAWEEVYLQQKRDEAPEAPAVVTIGEDESIHSVAQRFAVKQSVIERLNPKAKDRPGTKLRLR